MKKILFLGLLLFLSNLISSQNTEENFLLTTNSNRIGFASLKLLDPYISPSIYNGLGVRYKHEESRFLSLTNKSLLIIHNFDLAGGLTLNPTKSASMMYGAVNFDYGLVHRFPSFNGLKLMVGGSWDVDFGYKMISRNINNPVNIDLATNFNFSGIAKYDIQLFKQMIGLQLSVKAPVLGCMFVPRSGATYYEMFDLWNLDNAIHFSSLHNKQGINADFSCIVPFKTFTFNWGVNYQSLKYQANDMVFQRNEVSLFIGSRFDMIKFSGRQKKAPRNFISITQ